METQSYAQKALISHGVILVHGNLGFRQHRRRRLRSIGLRCCVLLQC